MKKIVIILEGKDENMFNEAIARYKNDLRDNKKFGKEILNEELANMLLLGIELNNNHGYQMKFVAKMAEVLGL